MAFFDAFFTDSGFCLKALVEKGWIKMDNFSKNPDKLIYAYLLTPTGVAEKAVLTRRFLQRKMADLESNVIGTPEMKKPA